ncbi:UDP-N-acetylglucosamine diphosphorylase/glucosamine-1-phosphate N-acetyltransferase [bacterium]|nr:MAG: UDP-N-acetylglucosamine diphosphorylase/glucosamine-1-phosphate N-acetyltransferase [bacterium]
MKKLFAVILAAGKGTRMKSAKTVKVLFDVSGRPMLFYPLNALKEAGVNKTIIVVGYNKDEVIECFKHSGALFAVQKEQLGTGHAVMCGLKTLSNVRSGTVLILSGDVPLITKETLKAFYKLHLRNNATLSLLTAVVDNPAGYGRIIRNTANEVIAVVEEKDATAEQKKIREVNAGIYLASFDFLRQSVKKLKNENTQNEYYLPDIVRLAKSAGKKILALTHASTVEVMGINNRAELSAATAIMRGRICLSLMLNGVTITDPLTTYIDYDVKIGPDSVIEPLVKISGNAVIGNNSFIGQGSIITNAVIGSNVIIKPYSIIDSCVIKAGANIGPFARLRPGSVISEGAGIGNFVEVKNSRVGKGSKANHLSYIGDAVIGKNANIGAGVITCNFDGVKKHTTRVNDGAFIGSDSQLVAPVTIGKNAYVGSGSTVTKDVPSGALIVSRAKERVIKDWVKKHRATKKH